MQNNAQRKPIHELHGGSEETLHIGLVQYVGKKKKGPYVEE
jgi:hypothetical protein